MKRHESSTDPRVREILARHARCRGGIPLRCSPTAYERRMREKFANPIETQNKIIYDSAEQAAAAAVEFAALDGGRPAKVYPCQRSKNGHCHLTTVNRR